MNGPIPGTARAPTPASHPSAPPIIAPELAPAVDLALAKVEGQLRRYKEKIQDHRRRPSTGDVAGAPDAEEPSEE